MDFALQNAVEHDADKAAYDILEQAMLPRALASAGATRENDNGKDK